MLLVFLSPLSFHYLLIPILVFIAVGIINFTNFMDGLDGLVAGCMFFVFLAIAINHHLPWSLWILLGSLIGFLLFNWSPAKIFMGDAGSTFLGAVFSGLLLHASSWSDAFGMLLLCTPLLADACLCVPRRLLAGQPIFTAHRLHLFQRLHQAGWSHSTVSFAYISSTAALGIAYIIGGLLLTFGVSTIILFVGFFLDQRIVILLSPRLALFPNFPFLSFRSLFLIYY